VRNRGKSHYGRLLDEAAELGDTLAGSYQLSPLRQLGKRRSAPCNLAQNGLILVVADCINALLASAMNSGIRRFTSSHSVISVYRAKVNCADRTRISMREIASHDADILRRLSVRQSAL
jgi:hypothetical protein